jgi:uncharacterized membrane protein YwaF
MSEEAIMKEFLGIGGYQREPEGYMSWQHLTFVSVILVIMAISAIYLGLRNRNFDYKRKNRTLMISSIAINVVELIKIVFICIRSNDVLAFLCELPLFLCSIQLITIPLAAFSHGRVKEAALDNVFMFGLLGAIMGTYFAGNNYGTYPVLSIDNVSSGITHAISGFAAIYIGVSGLISMKKKNIYLNFSIISIFCVMAYVVNRIIDYNYMFLMRGDGTPYDLIYNLVNGNKVLYPLIVVGLFLVYIFVFYYVFFGIVEKTGKKKKQKDSVHKEETCPV